MGPGRLRRFRGMFAFALFDERTGALHRWPATRSASSRCTSCRAASGVLFASELKAIVTRRRARADASTRGALVASTLFYWLPEDGRVARGRLQAAAGIVGASGGPTAPARAAPLLGPRRGSRGRGCRTSRPTSPRSSRSPSPRTSSPTCRSHPSSAAASTRASSPRWPPAANPAIEAYTITFRAEDQRLEAMPDDAVYARKMAAHLGIRLHEIEISPDVVDMLPRIVDVLDEPIGDPAAINTLLMCEAARDAGVKVLLSGMGADELFGGYRKHLACVLGARYQTAVPGRCARECVAPDRGPAAGRGRRARAALQPLGQALPHLRRAAGGGGVPAQLHPVRPGRARRTCSTPTWRRGVDAVLDGAPRPVYRRRADRPRQPDVPGRHPDVPARAQPRLHRPLEHGGVDRGPRARSSTRRSSARRSRFPATARSRGEPEGPLRKAAAEDWLRARSSTGRRPRSARRCGPG